VDNGKIYSARRLDAVCASLGIRKISCQPYSPEGKGKIERFFRTVREDFLAEPEVQKVQTLPELNKLFWAWLEVAYHQRVHSTTNAKPLERWQQHLGHYLRTVTEKELIELFLWQVSRKVNNVGLVSVEGLDFEVDSLLKQRQVEVRYNPFDLSWIHIYYQGRFFQKAYPFKLGRWSSALRPGGEPPPPQKPIPTGIKPLQQLAHKHRQQKQEHAAQLVGIPQSTTAPEPPFTAAIFIHQVVTSLAKSPEALHPREIERLQEFWKTHQPLRTETVGLAMAKAILTHGNNQHIDVYLNAIKALQLKWQKPHS